MIIFTKIKFKNFLSYGNNFTEINLNSHKTTLCIGKNGHGKCVAHDTLIKLQNKKTGEIIEMSIDEFYEKTKNKKS